MMNMLMAPFTYFFFWQSYISRTRSSPFNPVSSGVVWNSGWIFQSCIVDTLRHVSFHFITAL